MSVDLKPTSVTCPKCGYDQEERSDCRKCGVVFSKYYALHNPAKSLQSDGPEQPFPRATEETSAVEVNEYRKILSELQRLFNAIEFERAERNRINSEIKVLDRKMESSQAEVASRLGELERLSSGTASERQPSSREDLAEFKKDLLEVHFEPLIRRFDEIEERITALNRDSAPKTDPRVLEVLRKFEVRVTELESRASRISGEPEDASAGGRLAQLEDTLEGLTQELAGLKDTLACIQESKVTAALEEGSNLAGLDTRINDIACAVSGFEQKLESSALDLRRIDLQYQSLAESVEKTVELTKEIPQQASLLDSEFISLHAECEALRVEMFNVRENIEELLENQGVERAPLEEEVHTIRENLDELLRFMGSLARKA